MKCQKGVAGTMKSCERYIKIIAKVQNKNIFWIAISIFIMFEFILSGCEISKEKEEMNDLMPYGSISIKGDEAFEENMAITLNNNNEPAVSVTNGGILTLKNATIKKTALIMDNRVIGEEVSLEQNDGVGNNNEMAGVNYPGKPGPGNESKLPVDAIRYEIPPAGKQGEDPGPLGPGGPSGEALDTQNEMIQDSSGNKNEGQTAGVYVGSKGATEFYNVYIETDLDEGNGFLISGDGSSISFVKGAISTTGNSSRGGVVSKGGTANLNEVSVKTQTDNAIAIDMGGKITLENTSLWSNKKGAVMMCQDSSAAGVMSEIIIKGGEITAKEGPIFYVTNTDAVVNLKDVKTFSASGIVLKVLNEESVSEADNAKKSTCKIVTLNADEQVLIGDMVVGENCMVNVNLENESRFEGSINNNNKGKQVNLFLDESSTWDVTADSYLNRITVLEIERDLITNIKGNGHTIFYNKDLNERLGGKSYDLKKGGTLKPK